MQISKREKEVLSLVCFSDKEIAKHLQISPVTVKTYITNLFNKFFVNNRRELLIVALKHNVINIKDVIVRWE